MKIPKWLSTTFSFIIVGCVLVPPFFMRSPEKQIVTIPEYPVATNIPSFTHDILVGNTQLRVAFADTDGARELGLSNSAPLASGEGMLFLFPEEGIRTFWMKDMQYPIDIIWVSAGKHIVHIEHDLSPDTYPTIFSSPVPAQYVLEAPAGFVQKNGITIGTPFSF